METSTYIILALIAIFLFGPVSFSTPLRHLGTLRASVCLGARFVGDENVQMAALGRCLDNKVPRLSGMKQFTEKTS